jgi:hypothetical protein
LTTTGYEMRLEPAEEVNKMIRRENGKWTVYDEEGKRPFGTYDSKAAENRLAQMHQFKKAETFTPPKAVRSAARRALDWIAEGKAGERIYWSWSRSRIAISIRRSRIYGNPKANEIFLLSSRS